VKNGYLGLSPNGTLWANGPGPFSRLHLHDGLTSVLQAPYRPWMDNPSCLGAGSITFTTNSDQMYVGHKVEPGDDQTAAVIQWSDNNAPEAVFPAKCDFFLLTRHIGGPQAYFRCAIALEPVAPRFADGAGHGEWMI